MEVAAETAGAARDEPSDAGAAPERFEVRPQTDEPDDPETEGSFISSDDPGGGEEFLSLIGLDSFADGFVVAAFVLTHSRRHDFDGDDVGAVGLPDIDELIDHEVRAMEAFIEDARAGIIAKYAGFMIAARKTIPRGEIMGAIAALKAQRNAELAALKAEAAKALSKRIKDRLEERRAMRLNRRSPDGPQH